MKKIKTIREIWVAYRNAYLCLSELIVRIDSSRYVPDPDEEAALEAYRKILKISRKLHARRHAADPDWVLWRLSYQDVLQRFNRSRYRGQDYWLRERSYQEKQLTDAFVAILQYAHEKRLSHLSPGESFLRGFWMRLERPFTGYAPH